MIRSRHRIHKYVCESDDANASEWQVIGVKTIAGEWLALAKEERYALILKASRLGDVNPQRHKKSLQALACE